MECTKDCKYLSRFCEVKNFGANQTWVCDTTLPQSKYTSGPQASPLTSLDLSFLICSLGIIRSYLTDLRRLNELVHSKYLINGNGNRETAACSVLPLPGPWERQGKEARKEGSSLEEQLTGKKREAISPFCLFYCCLPPPHPHWNPHSILGARCLVAKGAPLTENTSELPQFRLSEPLTSDDMFS